MFLSGAPWIRGRGPEFLKLEPHWDGSYKYNCMLANVKVKLSLFWNDTMLPVEWQRVVQMHTLTQSSVFNSHRSEVHTSTYILEQGVKKVAYWAAPWFVHLYKISNIRVRGRGEERCTIRRQEECVKTPKNPKGKRTMWKIYRQKKKNSTVWVRERTIPTERPPPVGEVIANLLRIEDATWSAWHPYGRILGFLDRSRYFSNK
jgi:hypothetical protein